MGRSACLIVLLAAVIVGCGGTSKAEDENKAPEYAATPRKSLESWVAAVRAGDIEMMCRLLGPRPCKRALVKKALLPAVRAEMRGLKGELHYGAINIGAPEARSVVGVVSGESPIAYAVPVRRGMTQWSISEEGFPPYSPKFARRIVLNQPDPAAVLVSGRTPISVTAWMLDPGSSYPNAELWIDSRHVDGRTEDLDYFQSRSDGFERVRWIGAPRLLPGRHVMVVGVRPDLEARAWVLTVR